MVFRISSSSRALGLARDDHPLQKGHRDRRPMKCKDRRRSEDIHASKQASKQMPSAIKSLFAEESSPPTPTKEHVCMYVYMYIYVYIYIYTCVCVLICMYVCMYVCTYVRTYVCMLICIDCIPFETQLLQSVILIFRIN